MLPLPSLPGAVVVARDVPAAVFFADYPAPEPDGPPSWEPAARQQQHLALEAWASGLLTRVVVAPRLGADQVERLGADRDALLRAYWRAVGWLPAAPDEPARRPSPEPGPPGPPALGALVSVPPPGLARLVHRLAAGYGAMPSVVWQQPISEFLFNAAVLMAAERQRPDGGDLFMSGVDAPLGAVRVL